MDIKDLDIRKKVKYSLRLKIAVSILVFSLLYYFVAIVFGAYVNSRFAVYSIVKRNYHLARCLAVSLDQNYTAYLFDKTRELYEDIPVEDRNSTDYQAYQDSFSVYKNEKYDYLVTQLRRIVNENELSWMNMQVEDTANNTTCFVLDTDHRPDGRYSAGYIGKKLPYNYFDGKIEYCTLEDVDEGIMIITRAPFYRNDSNEIVGYICIGEKQRDVLAQSLTFIIVFGLILLVLMLIFIKISVGGITHMVIKPIEQLALAAESFSHSKRDGTESHYFGDIKIRSQDEIRQLADSMGAMEHDIYVYTEDLKKSTMMRTRIKAELDVASRIQAKMLPDSLTGYNGIKDFSICAGMHPAKEVGGDFYDFFTIDDDHIGITISDVSDKGVPASLLMVTTRTLIKNNAMNIKDPAEVLRMTNRALCENNEEAMFVTVFFGIYTVSEKILRYVNAGHENPAVYRKENGVYDLIIEDHDLVLGIMEDIELNVFELKFNPGDRLFLYTDGVPDASDPDGTAFGIDNMINCLNRHSDMTGQAVLDTLQSEISDFEDGLPQFDDMTMLLLEIN